MRQNYFAKLVKCELLTEITGKNAFVNYDSRLKTYHMHNILTDFLKEVLDRKDTSYKQDLYQKAARWHLKSSDYMALTDGNTVNFGGQTWIVLN